MTEKEQVLQFIKENDFHERYVSKFDNQWKGYTVYSCNFTSPYEIIGLYPLTVLVKNGKIRQATYKEIDEIRAYQSKFIKKDNDGRTRMERMQLDMESLSLLSDMYPELKEKMKTCNDEKELTAFFRSEILGVDD